MQALGVPLRVRRLPEWLYRIALGSIDPFLWQISYLFFLLVIDLLAAAGESSKLWAAIHLFVDLEAGRTGGG